LEEIADDSTDYFVGDAGNAFREKFKDILVYFPVLENSMISYKSDLENFLQSYINFEANYKLSDDADGKSVSTKTGISNFNSNA